MRADVRPTSARAAQVDAGHGAVDGGVIAPAQRRQDGGPAGVFTTDLALVVQSWDRWLMEATGLAESDVYGRPIAELFPDLERRGLLGRLRRVAEAGAVEVLASAFHAYLLPCPPRAPSAHSRGTGESCSRATYCA